MGRTSKALTSALLILALAAVTVPAGVNLAPALLPGKTAAAPAPAAQLAPTSLSTLPGVAPLPATAPLPDPAKLGKAMDAALALGNAGQFSAYVTDAASGTVLYSKDGDSARTPASNLKLLTATAALTVLGAGTRLQTSVVAGDEPNVIILRAGGDSMLSEGRSDPTAVMGHAGLATLAAKTAAALAAGGVKGPVTLRIDDHLFTGPALNPAWDPGDVNAGEIAPVYPMALYAGRTSAGADGPRPQDSALAVAVAFSAALKDAGVEVAGAITRTPAATTSPAVLASVSSATVARQVQYLLTESDNYMAEVMGRLVAVKEGRAADNTGSVAAVRSVLARLGLPLPGVVTVDNCGLAGADLISAHQLVQVVSHLLAHAGSDAGQALEGLPVAGLTGTLGGRFSAADTVAAAGVLHAKTGTLNQVSTLSGYVVNAQGRLLAFSLMGNQLDGGPASAIPAIDAAAAALAAS
ncbi:D-alanyl-D-alanine carboxypeptidase/D-alanyl-D-alanine-endopeptidase [Arthrobacter sp. STN4]|uniref:D-alanyl-D-alanine carboxypeptidase/D-alanyl-D-alanine endopeptidase n=1 Tax=Arthrobacter sp. STN4 TaxID=2923276 RepID=UPI00211A3B2A|nr:D-alanyl-D-alanine carboxypeptidase/D-alanyl-D-alanine-endopeptidase [Arthrobacter sp. STN4]MCQ9162569.1 D-alanyl-D-alanine carboxypeptidase/D-alanyl-D-alanine-endopeptidase [Arthrobacter sp. STN4]